MTPITNLRAWLLLSLFVVSTLSAMANTSDPQERNYRVIIDRNPFGLKPPPPPPTNTPVSALPKDEILLTGITSIGQLKAYFQSKAPAQGKPPTDTTYYALGVDEKKNGLEVLEINLKEKSVRVRNAGVESVMNFASNGVKAPAAPALPAGSPGAPGASGHAGVATAGGPPPLPGASMHPGGGSVPPGGVSTISTTPTGTSRVRTIPSRNLRTPTTQVNPPVDPNAQNAAPDPNAGVQDVLMMELQKRANPHVEFPPTPFQP